MSAAEAQFAARVEQIKQEHDGKLKVLKADLDAVTTLLEAEQRRLGSTQSAPNARPQPKEPLPRQRSAQPPEGRPRLADMIGLQRVG